MGQSMKLISHAKTNGGFLPSVKFQRGLSAPLQNAVAMHGLVDFELSIGTSCFEQPEVLAAWYRLLADVAGPEKLYQSPEFFRYMVETNQQGNANHELYIFRRSADSRIVGIVPVRLQIRDIPFRFGPVSLFKHRVAICQMLGSVPLLDPAERGLKDFVFKELLKQRPDCAALAMQALPSEQFDSMTRCEGLSSYVLDGWRDCHVAPLPANVDDYLQKFSSKKRYNLSRQIRLLAKEAGEVQILRIDQADQIDLLMTAMRAVAPPEFLSRPDRRDRLISLARNDLLLSYVIRCGTEDVAVLLGSRSNGTWHVHTIWGQQKYMRLSVGTSATHLAFLDVIENDDLTLADFGYGTPNQEFRSTHVLASRGFVMLYRSHSALAAMLKVHAAYDRFNVALIRRVKQLKKAYEQYKRRQERPAAEAAK
jgi:hypothetical protein